MQQKKPHLSQTTVFSKHIPIKTSLLQESTQDSPPPPPPPQPPMNHHKPAGKHSSATASPQPNRVFTEQDEINLLQSHLNNKTPQQTSYGHFKKSQITDKLRRLKKKYHKLAKTKSSIKTPHDRQIYEIALKIWGKNDTSNDPTKPLDDHDDEDIKGKGVERPNWPDFPFLMENVSRAFPGREEIYREGLEGLGLDIVQGLDQKWKKLDLEEAKLAARKNQLYCDQLKLFVDGSDNNL